MVDIFTTETGSLEGCELLNGEFQMHYGASAPVTTHPFQNWGDTGNNRWKQRNEADDDWISRGILNAENFGFALESEVIPQAGWTPFTDTLTYASATTVTTPVDLSSTLRKGFGIKFDQGGVTKYFYSMTTPVFVDPNSTLTVSFGNNSAGTVVDVANSAITNAYWTPLPKIASGFPTVFNMPTITYTTSGTAFTNVPSTTFAYFWVDGVIANVILRITFNATSGGTGTVYGTLSGLPAPISNIGSCNGHRYTDLKTLAVQYVSTNTRFEIALYDGTTCIANSNIIMVNGSWRF